MTSSDEIHIGLEEVAFHLAARIVLLIWRDLGTYGEI